jgi:hypothetical protein
MSSRDSRRTVRTLLLATVLLLPAAAHAAPLRESRAVGRSFFSSVLDSVRGVFSGWVNVYGKEGVSIDPNGKPTGTTGGTSTPQGEEGMLIDPHG